MVRKDEEREEVPGCSPLVLEGGYFAREVVCIALEEKPQGESQ